MSCAAALLMSACMVGPDYKPPSSSHPAAFRFSASDTSSANLPSDWWTMFGDAELDRHIGAVLASNQNLAFALARYDESRALLGVARAGEFPAVSLDPSYARIRTSFTVDDAFPVRDITLNQVPLDLSYEIDFWGRVRRTVAAAQAQIESVGDAVADLRLSLAAATATLYFSVRSADREIGVLSQTVKVREDARQLAERRARAGVVGDIDVVRARADLALTRADLDEAQRRRETALRALAVLENRNAAEFEIAVRAWIPPLPEIPAGLPSQLLKRRPDIAERERILAAANEQIGVAEAAFFPTVRVTAFGGVASGTIEKLFDNASLIGAIGPSIGFPLFDGGRNRANFEAAQARYRQALASYRGSVLTAFSETQDALSDAAYLDRRSGNLHEAVTTSTTAAAISRSRYERGLAGYFEVVDSERAALTNQRAEIQNDQLRLSAAIALVKALGGGWTPDAPIPSGPAEPAPGKLPPLPTALAAP
jgi:multidrug efflux system outer membrane protein